MKVIEYSSVNFWKLLDEHLSLREIETDVKIDQIVKSILEDVKKFGDKKIIQFAKDNPDLKLALLCPTQSLVKNIGQDYTDAPCGFGIDFLQHNRFTNFI